MSDMCPEHPVSLMRGCPHCRKDYPCPEGAPNCNCPDFDHRQLLFQAAAGGDRVAVFHNPSCEVFVPPLHNTVEHFPAYPTFRNDPSKDLFLILSIKWSRGGVLTWWGPDNNGYVTDIDNAGRYTREQVETKADYYNDGKSTRAIFTRDVYEGKVGKVRRTVEGYAYPDEDAPSPEEDPCKHPLTW